MPNLLPNLPNIIKNMRASLSSNYRVSQDDYNNHIARYDQLKAYYDQNGLYNSLQSANYYLNTWHESMKPLRNPANRSVEFFADRIIPGTLPGDLPIVTENTQIIDPIHQIWKWSNLNSKKAPESRNFAIYGDMFIHPTPNNDMTQVYLQFVDPRCVTDWKCDNRGYITNIRIDMPLGDGKTHIEVWDLFTHKIWETTMNAGTPLGLMGDAQMTIPISDYGIDFVPFVQSKFRDIGEKYGVGAFAHVLDKIDEANRMATRFHEMMFRYNKPYWAMMANAVDSEGKPLPAPKFKSSDKSTSAFTGKETMDIPDDAIFGIPGMAKLEALIPNLHYSELLAGVQDMMLEIEKDLPEIAIHKLMEKGELSGVAIRNLLGDAISRLNEARMAFEGGLIRADEMALTIGTNLGLWNVGNYDAGDFSHSFQPREAFPVTLKEKLANLQALIAAGVPLEKAAEIADISELLSA